MSCPGSHVAFERRCIPPRCLASVEYTRYFALAAPCDPVASTLSMLTSLPRRDTRTSISPRSVSVAAPAPPTARNCFQSGVAFTGQVSPAERSTLLAS